MPDNSQIFRQKITDFSGLIKYTQKVLNSETEFECFENGNIVTKDIIYQSISAWNNLFYITENKPIMEHEVLFWEKESDKSNWFSSAGKLSRLVRKLFEKSEQMENSRKFSKKRVEKINQKIQNLLN